jgi:hypothetical protein
MIVPFLMVEDSLRLSSVNKTLRRYITGNEFDSQVWKAMYYNEFYQEEYPDISKHPDESHQSYFKRCFEYYTRARRIVKDLF